MSLRWIVLLVLLLAGCASHLPVREPVHEAELAMQAGARLFEAGDPGAGTELRRALELEPGWVAPQRMLDELARSELRLPEVLAMRRVDATSAGGLYLRARLEGDDGERYYRRALELDPACAFAHHGLGVLATRAGRPALAEQCANRAWQHARGQWERGFFGLALARTIQRVRGPRAGCEAIAGMLRTSDFSRVDRLRLETQLVLWRARISEPDALLEDALRLARDPAISDVDLRLLASGLPMRADAELEWMIALGSSPGAVREELRAQLELARAPGALALARHASAQPPPRALLFALDRGREAVESWLAGLPPQVLDAQGLPRDPRLVRVVQLVRAGAGRELGAALLECGWFSEARAFANTLARSDLPAALELDDRALAGQARVTQLVRIARSSESLEEALGKLGLEASPRLEFGPLGTLVHPGPWFSTLDEREGLGSADAPVPGLAQELDALGRFALLGEVIIQKGVDGVVLPRLLVEQTGGSVLGQPWQGTVAWCEGQELSPRAVQFGGHIHAAALHEGFWLDVASVRREREEWVKLARRFEEPGLRARALAVAALPANGAPDVLFPALDAADRLRLAVIAERGVPTLEEFIEATAVHEAAHVVDRQRFLPLHSGWPRALRLLADCGFSPRMFGEELEARAQLAALCEAREPRILLAHLLEAAGGEFGKQVPHALGYQRLLARLLKRCNGHPGLDSSRLLVQQLHRLSVQDLRALARAQASAMGLDRP